MRHYAPSSRRQAVALPAVGKTGRMARGNRRLSPWLESSDTDTARLELLEGFLNRSDVADCTEFALQWVAESAAVLAACSCHVRRVFR